MPDQTSGHSHQVSGYIRMLASYVYVRPFSHRICHSIWSIYVKIVLIMKDDGFTDENVCLTCSRVRQNSLKDLNISSIMSSYMSLILTKTVFRVSDQIRTNRAVHCIAVIRKEYWPEFSYLVSKGIKLSMLQNKCADQLRGNHIIYKYVLIFVKIIKIYM